MTRNFLVESKICNLDSFVNESIKIANYTFVNDDQINPFSVRVRRSAVALEANTVTLFTIKRLRYSATYKNFDF